jgi:hypothetical protein
MKKRDLNHDLAYSQIYDETKIAQFLHISVNTSSFAEKRVQVWV